MKLRYDMIGNWSDHYYTIVDDFLLAEILHRKVKILSGGEVRSGINLEKEINASSLICRIPQSFNSRRTYNVTNI